MAGAGGCTSCCLELLVGSPPWISAWQGGDGGTQGEPLRWPEQVSTVLGERHAWSRPRTLPRRLRLGRLLMYYCRPE